MRHADHCAFRLSKPKQMGEFGPLLHIHSALCSVLSLYFFRQHRSQDSRRGSGNHPPRSTASKRGSSAGQAACDRRDGHSVHAPLYCRWPVSDKGVPDLAGQSGLHLAWHSVRSKQVRWLQVQNLRARSRQAEQPEWCLHQRTFQRSDRQRLDRGRSVPRQVRPSD